MSDIPTNMTVPVIGFAAFSGTGKTSLLKKLIPLLCSRQLRVGLIKQSHHDVEVDTPGKDSYELRKAGAAQTLLASPFRSVVIHEHTRPGEQDLASCLGTLDTTKLDVILVEGFKHACFTKIEIQRQDLNKPLLYTDDKNIVAIITDDVSAEHTLPVLNLNDPDEICDYICQHLL